MMCDCLGVTRSCYYAWCNLQPSARAKEDGLLCEGIRVIFEISRQTYGTRRIRRELFKEGKTVSRRRIGKLMR